MKSAERASCFQQQEVSRTSADVCGCGVAERDVSVFTPQRKACCSCFSLFIRLLMVDTGASLQRRWTLISAASPCRPQMVGVSRHQHPHPSSLEVRGFCSTGTEPAAEIFLPWWWFDLWPHSPELCSKPLRKRRERHLLTFEHLPKTAAF